MVINMEVAKVTSKGQITIPISIRKRLGINEGDKILFIYKPDGVMMVNPNSIQGGVDDIVDVTETKIPTQVAAVAKEKATPKAKVSANKITESIQNVDISDNVATEPPLVEASDPTPESPPDEEFKGSDTFNLNTLMDDLRSMGSL